MKRPFCYAVQKINTALSAHNIAIQLYFIRLFSELKMAMIFLSTAYEAFLVDWHVFGL